MSMHYGPYIRPHAVNQKMHSNLACNCAAPFDLPAIHVDDDHVGGLHAALGHARGRDQHSVFVQPNRKISVSGGDIATLVQQFAYPDNLPPDCVFCAHQHSYGAYRIAGSKWKQSEIDARTTCYSRNPSV